MNSKDIPMVADRLASMPKIYGDIPSFLGTEVLNHNLIESGFDVIFAGVPWEGTVTWGAKNGCEDAPKTIRYSSARYGGFLPEYEMNVFDFLKIGDIGDVTVHSGNSAQTMKNVFDAMDKIYKKRSVPFVFGGDHSFSPEIVKALSKNSDGDIGIIHFDSHFDNMKSYGEDEYSRCGPIHRISQIEKVRNKSIVHIAIGGPRNSYSQMEYAKNMGASAYTIKEIRERGIGPVIEEAISIARERTKNIYVTICSDCVDATFNPGGPADFNGLFPHELFSALFRIGEEGIAGLDYVEVYPNFDPKATSSHLATWAVIHALAGLASRKKKQG